MKPNTLRARGFTLIEMIIVTVIIGIMGTALVPLTISSLRAYRETVDNVAVLDKLRYATERLAREIREVNYDATTGFAFTNKGINDMSFTRTYIDANGAASGDTLVTVGTTSSAVTLTYSLPSGVGAQVLTDELGVASNLNFSYYMADGTTPTTSNTEVRYVEINLTLRHKDNDYHQRTRVELKRFSPS